MVADKGLRQTEAFRDFADRPRAAQTEHQYPQSRGVTQHAEYLRERCRLAMACRDIAVTVGSHREMPEGGRKVAAGSMK